MVGHCLEGTFIRGFWAHIDDFVIDGTRYDTCEEGKKKSGLESHGPVGLSFGGDRDQTSAGTWEGQAQP